MKIIIGADLVPTKSNYDYFINGNIEEIIDERILEILNNADYRIFNLEVPLTDYSNPISKHGPHLIAPTATINGIKKIKIDFLNLSNNHILDHGVNGLLSTIEILNKNDICYGGAGDISQAQKCFYFEKNGKKYGIFSCAEHEFSIVSKNNVGANPFDPLETLDLIKESKLNCDYLIVLYHGGKEQYRYPSPNLQKVCRKLIDKGADLVVCQHSHCVGAKENYRDGVIIYGQGNFLFDMLDNEYWGESLLIELNIQNDKIDINYIPIIKCGNGVKLADEYNKNRILKEFNDRSAIVNDSNELEKMYVSLSLEHLEDFILSLNRGVYKSFVFKVLNKIMFGKLKTIVVNKYISKNKNFLINKIECEAHCELILTGLKNKDIN